MRTLGFVFLSLVILVSFYVFWRIWQILPFGWMGKSGIVLLFVTAFALLFVNFLSDIDQMPMALANTIYHISTSWLVIMLYMLILFLLMDLGRLLHLVPNSLMQDSVRGTLMMALLITSIFTYGYFNYRHKVRVPINMVTDKPLTRPLKLVMISDLHLGYPHGRAELARWIKMINDENPDFILVAGDIIDRNIRPLKKEKMADEFRNLQAPVYACLGNHEYYCGIDVAKRFYQKAGIHLLIDSTAQIDGINVIGRDDRTNQRRQPLQQIMQQVDRSKFTILLDHQPYHLEEAEQNGIDFQLSGHTHNGQVWPISWIESRMYELAYGHLKKGNTEYYVSSGLGIWGGKFRIGTQSEYVVLTLQAKQ